MGRKVHAWKSYSKMVSMEDWSGRGSKGLMGMVMIKSRWWLLRVVSGGYLGYEWAYEGRSYFYYSVLIGLQVSYIQIMGFK